MPSAMKVNKSEEVRKLISSGVTSGPEIMAKLKTRGIKIAPAQVYQILAKKKGKKAKKKSSAKQQNGTVLDHAIVFVRSAGGMENAKELLSKLSLLRN
jgi:uroporphyrinogen-III synthase